MKPTELITNINFNDLCNQKRSLQVMIGYVDCDSDIYNDLVGILHLLDNIQDCAVDELGLKEDEVFVPMKVKDKEQTELPKKEKDVIIYPIDDKESFYCIKDRNGKCCEWDFLNKIDAESFALQSGWNSVKSFK